MSSVKVKRDRKITFGGGSELQKPLGSVGNLCVVVLLRVREGHTMTCTASATSPCSWLAWLFLVEVGLLDLA